MCNILLFRWTGNISDTRILTFVAGRPRQMQKSQLWIENIFIYQYNDYHTSFKDQFILYFNKNVGFMVLNATFNNISVI